MIPEMREQVLEESAECARTISHARVALLFALFFAICLGLGYPSLNRVDRMTAPGLNDVQWYAGMVMHAPPIAAGDHRLYRVLVPAMARPVYLAARGRIASWDPTMLGLLVVDSLFVAGTVTLLMAVVMWSVGDYAVALCAAFIYLVNFAVPNLRLAGFIDAGEAFFLMLAVWGLLRRRWWLLPVIAVPGAMAKESFVPFLMVLSTAWWSCERRSMASRAAWAVASWAAGLATLCAVQWKVGHVVQSPMAFGLSLNGGEPWMAHLVHSLADRNLWYIFFWLAPLGALHAGRFPLAWRAATVATAVSAFALDAYYGGAPGTIGRALFTVAGPLLSAGVAVLLFERTAGRARTVQEV